MDALELQVRTDSHGGDRPGSAVLLVVDLRRSVEAVPYTAAV